MSGQFPAYQMPVAIALLVLGAAFLCWAIWSLVTSLRSRSWPVAEATIVESRVEEEYDDGMLYRPVIAYRYEVDGREWTGNNVSLGATVASSSARRAQKTVEKYALGTCVAARYCPTSPDLSVLEPGLKPATAVAFLVACFILFSGWSLLTGAVVLN